MLMPVSISSWRLQPWLPPPSAPTARSEMRPIGMPARRAASCASASARSALNCSHAWNATSRACSVAKRATSGLSGSRNASGQSRQCQWPPLAANRCACSASKRACDSSASPRFSRNARKSGSSAGVCSNAARNRASRVRLASGQSTSFRPSSFADTPSAAPSGSGACSTLSIARLEGAYGLNRSGSAENCAWTGLIATADAPCPAADRTKSASAAKSPIPPSPFRRKP